MKDTKKLEIKAVVNGKGNISKLFLDGQGVDIQYPTTPTEEQWEGLQSFEDLEENEVEAALIYLREDIGKWDVESFRDSYQGDYGEYFTPGAVFAEDYCEDPRDVCGVPSWIANNIDWNGVWRDLELDGFEEIDGHIFYRY